MTELVFYLMLFLAIGFGFIFIHLLIGKIIRPNKPDPEKLTIYECGEPTIGSAWIQFDLRFYVVALLFVIFDVEVAFFFPWAVVFGKANDLAKLDLNPEKRLEITYQLTPVAFANKQKLLDEKKKLVPDSNEAMAIDSQIKELDKTLVPDPEKNAKAGSFFGWIAFYDILVFFGVILIGFAYLWKRGDLDWVRSLSAERMALGKEDLPSSTAELVGGHRIS